VKKGKLITIEGLDGAGKSTLIKGLNNALGGNNLCLREPGGTVFADSVAELVRGHDDQLAEPESDLANQLLRRWLDRGQELDPYGELLIFNAARADLIDQVVAPALDAGKTVLLDRFYDSTIAYQGYGRGLDVNQVEEICLEATGGIIPDRTFYLEIGPEERSRRLAQRPLDRIEATGDGFYSRVAEGFRALIEKDPKRWVALDGEGAPEEIVFQASRLC